MVVSIVLPITVLILSQPSVMARSAAYVRLIFVLLLICTEYQQFQVLCEQMSRKEKRDREVERKMKRVSEATKATVHAMREAGVHDSLIHQRLAEEVGTVRSAKIIVDKLKEEAEEREKQRKLNEPITLKTSRSTEKEKSDERNSKRTTPTEEERRKEIRKGQTKSQQRFHQDSSNIKHRIEHSKSKAKLKKEFLRNEL